jgi:hypothetical protein
LSERLGGLNKACGYLHYPPDVIAELRTLESRLAEAEAALVHCQSQAGPDSCADVLARLAALERAGDAMVATMQWHGEQTPGQALAAWTAAREGK